MRLTALFPGGVLVPRRLAVLVSTNLLAAALAGDPWADSVVEYDPGATPAPDYTDAQTVLGSPERFTGEQFGYPAVVSIFNPAFGTDELVSIGEGGALTVKFDDPIRDAAGHAFGADFIIFGNGGFGDDDFPNGRIGSPPFTFGMDPYMRVSVSADGTTFVPLGSFTEGFFPAQGYLDSGPFDDHPGDRPTDFTRPVDPRFTLADFDGKRLTDVLAMYDGAGGGTPLDLAGSGLSEVSYVRIEVLDDHDPSTELNVEVDAFAAVPEPATALLVLAAGIITTLRRGR